MLQAQKATDTYSRSKAIDEILRASTEKVTWRRIAARFYVQHSEAAQNEGEENCDCCHCHEYRLAWENDAL